MIITHPTTNQLALGRVYMRNPTTQDLYIQHYQVTSDLIDSYQLKNTKRNLSSKGFTKHSSTTDTSVIIKCTDCHLYDEQHLVEAN